MLLINKMCDRLVRKRLTPDQMARVSEEKVRMLMTSLVVDARKLSNEICLLKDIEILRPQKESSRNTCALTKEMTELLYFVDDCHRLLSDS